MIDFRRGRDLVRGAEPKALPKVVEPSLREVLRDPIVRSRMAADHVRIRDILDLAIGFRNIAIGRKIRLACGPTLGKKLGLFADQEKPCRP